MTTRPPIESQEENEQKSQEEEEEEDEEGAWLERKTRRMDEDRVIDEGISASESKKKKRKKAKKKKKTKKKEEKRPAQGDNKKGETSSPAGKRPRRSSRGCSTLDLLGDAFGGGDLDNEDDDDDDDDVSWHEGDPLIAESSEESCEEGEVGAGVQLEQIPFWAKQRALAVESQGEGAQPSLSQHNQRLESGPLRAWRPGRGDAQLDYVLEESADSMVEWPMVCMEGDLAVQRGR